jgi:uncharacterized protein YgiB involved in biofilm formation
MADPKVSTSGMGRLKRSRVLHLSSLMATASFTLAACGSPPQANAPQNNAATNASASAEGSWDTRVEGAFQSMDECVASGTATASECEAAYRTAANQAAENAPKFGSQADCEQEFGAGQCQQRTEANGTSMFMPLLAGFMLGRLLSGGNRAPASPLFRRGDSLRTPDGQFAGRTRPTTAAPAATTTRTAQAQNGSRAVSRGGFGTSNRSSYGG